MAAAVFDDPNKVVYTPLNAEERFEALRSGKIDVLSRNSSWTLERTLPWWIETEIQPLSCLLQIQRMTSVIFRLKLKTSAHPSSK